MLKIGMSQMKHCHSRQQTAEMKFKVGPRNMSFLFCESTDAFYPESGDR